MTLDGIDVEEFGLKALMEHENPLNAEIVHKTLKIPSRDGLYYFGSEINEKPFLLTFDVIEDNPVEMQHKLNTFTAFLYDSYGQPKTIKAIFDYEPDKYYMVMVNARITPTRLYGVSQFTLPFVVYDSYKHSTVYADEILWGSTAITFQSSYLLGHTGSAGLTTVTADTTLHIFADGIAVKPIIEITGSATDFVISTNGYTISLGTFASTTWVIDCDKYTVLKNGAGAFISNFRDFILLPGNNNVSIAGTEINLSIRIKLRDKYI